MSREWTVGVNRVVFQNDVFGTGKFSEYLNSSDKVVGVQITMTESEDPLRAINRTENFISEIRAFMFTENGKTHTINANLGNTGKGTLYINKDDSTFPSTATKKSNVTISGAGNYSMFNIGEDVSLYAEDVTFLNAGGEDWSVFNIGPNAGKVVLQNVIFTGNNGNAILNAGGDTTLTNVTFNTATDNNNALTNAGDMVIKDSSIASNLYNKQNSRIKFTGGTSSVVAVDNQEAGATISVDGATLNFNGLVKNAEGAVIEFIGGASADIKSGASIVNDGTLNIVGVNNFNVFGNILNNEKGIVNINSGQTVTLTNSGSAYIGNYGTFTANGNIDLKDNSQIYNEGTFTLGSSGNIAASGNSTIEINKGKFDVVGTIAADSTSLANLHWIIGADGTLSVQNNGAGVIFDSTDRWNGKVVVKGGKFTVVGDSSVMRSLGENAISSEEGGPSRGYFINDGTTLDITGSNAGYTGYYQQFGGILSSSSSNLFSGEKQINYDGVSSKPAVVNIVDEGRFSFNKMYLGNYATLTSTSTGGTITSKDSDFVKFMGRNSKLVFNPVATSATYTLSSDINWIPVSGNVNIATNEVLFNSGTLRFTPIKDQYEGYLYSGPKYVLSNTNIDMHDDGEVYYTRQTFESLYSTSNFNMKIDLDLTEGINDSLVIREGGKYDGSSGKININIDDISFNVSAAPQGDKTVTLLTAPTNNFKLSVADKVWEQLIYGESGSQ